MAAEQSTRANGFQTQETQHSDWSRQTCLQAYVTHHQSLPHGNGGSLAIIWKFWVCGWRQGPLGSSYFSDSSWTHRNTNRWAPRWSGLDLICYCLHVPDAWLRVNVLTQAAVTKYHRLRGLNTGVYRLIIPEAGVPLLVGLVSSEASLLDM